MLNNLKTEIRVLALRRSGHHAIINWIIANLEGDYVFLNNCKLTKHPWDYCVREESKISDFPFEYQKNLLYETKAQTLIHNYEDISLKDFSNHFKSTQEWSKGKRGVRRVNILVIRDPFNNLASYYHWHKTGSRYVPSYDRIERIRDLWKEHANYYKTKNKCIHVAINYNNWIEYPEYKQMRASFLNLISWDKGFDKVAQYGPSEYGGCFQDVKDAKKLEVLTRYKKYRSDPYFVRLFDDSMVQQAYSLFGLNINWKLLKK